MSRILEQWLERYGTAYPKGEHEDAGDYAMRMLRWFEPLYEGLLMQLVADSFGIELEEALALAAGHVLDLSFEQFNDIDPERRVNDYHRVLLARTARTARA